MLQAVCRDFEENHRKALSTLWLKSLAIGLLETGADVARFGDEKIAVILKLLKVNKISGLDGVF